MILKQSHYYSNGAYGRTWGVRMVMTIQPDPDTGEDMVHFKGVAGSSRRQTGSMPLDEFQRWAKYEVRLVENDWKRVDEPTPG
jgi:hypothetical protein